MDGLTVGVDVARGRATTAVCTIRWEVGVAVVEAALVGAGDAMVLAAATAPGVAVKALDAPFGWSAAMVAAVSSWRPGEGGRSPRTLRSGCVARTSSRRRSPRRGSPRAAGVQSGGVTGMSADETSTAASAAVSTGPASTGPGGSDQHAVRRIGAAGYEGRWIERTTARRSRP